MLGTVDEWKLVVLMLFGGVFALAGLGLLVYRSSDTTQTHAELFGQKFRISSSGLVVFLVGAAFLAAPLVVEGVSENTLDRGSGGAMIDSGSGSNGTASDKEQEPNNSMQQANWIEFGRVYNAILDNNDIDVFAVKTGELSGRAVRIVFTPVETEGTTTLAVLKIHNDNGQEVFTGYTRERQAEFRFNLRIILFIT